MLMNNRVDTDRKILERMEKQYWLVCSKLRIPIRLLLFKHKRHASVVELMKQCQLCGTCGIHRAVQTVRNDEYDGQVI